MMKSILTAVTLLALSVTSVVPAFAGDANNEPFDNNHATLSTTSASAFYRGPMTADVGSTQYPSTVGRPGTVLTALNNDVLPVNGSDGPVQTANSLPRGFEQGTVTYAQAESVNRWMIAHSGVGMTRTASR